MGLYKICSFLLNTAKIDQQIFLEKEFCQELSVLKDYLVLFDIVFLNVSFASSQKIFEKSFHTNKKSVD